MSLTIKQILKATPKPIHNVASYVRASNVKLSKKIPRLTATTMSTHDNNGEPKRSPQRYETIVTGLMGTGTLLTSKYVKVSCTCDFFWAHSEVALHKQGAADIHFSNGKDPVVRNPKMIPYVCKHLVKVLKLIDQRGL